MNHRTLLLLLSFISAALPALAEPVRSEYSTGASSLRLVSRSDGGKDGYFARFVGKVRLTGTLVVEFDRLPDMPEDRDTEGEAFFLPDQPSRDRLPAAVGSFYPRAVNSISLDRKPRQLLLPLLGRKRADSVLNGSMARYELPAALTIKSFSSWVECDHRSYTAEVVSVESLQPEFLVGAKPLLIGC